jgi:hypothetical protein
MVKIKSTRDWSLQMMQVTLEGFFACDALEPLAFHLLDKPTVIRGFPAVEGTELIIFALAWTAGEERCAMHALALTHVVGDPSFEEELIVLRTREQFLKEYTEWEYNPRFFFREWVQRWLTSHPAQLVHGGTIAARALSQQ